MTHAINVIFFKINGNFWVFYVKIAQFLTLLIKYTAGLIAFSFYLLNKEIEIRNRLHYEKFIHMLY